MNVFGAVKGLIGVARFAFACALISSVSRDGDVAECGKALGVQPCNLFFNAAVGVGNNNSGVFFCRVIACRGVNIGGNFQPVQLVAYWVDIYLPFYVLSNGIAVNKPPGVSVCRFGCKSCACA